MTTNRSALKGYAKGLLNNLAAIPILVGLTATLMMTYPSLIEASNVGYVDNDRTGKGGDGGGGAGGGGGSGGGGGGGGSGAGTETNYYDGITSPIGGGGDGASGGYGGGGGGGGAGGGDYQGNHSTVTDGTDGGQVDLKGGAGGQNGTDTTAPTKGQNASYHDKLDGQERGTLSYGGRGANGGSGAQGGQGGQGYSSSSNTQAGIDGESGRGGQTTATSSGGQGGQGGQRQNSFSTNGNDAYSASHPNGPKAGQKGGDGQEGGRGGQATSREAITDSYQATESAIDQLNFSLAAGGSGGNGGGGGGAGAPGGSGQSGDQGESSKYASKYKGGYGAAGESGAIGGKGGRGGDGGDGAKGRSVNFTLNSTLESLAINGSSNLKTGQGGDGGHGALAGRDYSDSSNFTSGGDGGHGGAGNEAGNLILTITPKNVIFNDKFSAAAGAGGQGGDGGGSPNDFSSPNLGAVGGHGGAAGKAGDITVNFLSQNVSFKDYLTVSAGNGGLGGEGGLKTLANAQSLKIGGDAGAGAHGGSVYLNFSSDNLFLDRGIWLSAGDGASGGADGGRGGGKGGAAGSGGEVKFSLDGDLTLNGGDIYLSSGSGGHHGQTRQQGGGRGGDGGAATMTVHRNLLVTNDSTINFSKGADNDGQAGALNFSVGEIFEIGPEKSVTLNFNGTMEKATDKVLFKTIFLNRGSSLSTKGEVYSPDWALNSITSGRYYRAQNLDIIHNAIWDTNGLFAPNSAQFDYMRFDMTDIAPWQTMLTFSPNQNGTVDLSNFDPVNQHQKYLAHPNRPLFMDEITYHRGYDGIFDSNSYVAPAFLTSSYQTKPLSLGQITLISRTNGLTDPTKTSEDSAGNRHYISDDSAQGALYNDFAYSAGLRRYYWDVFVSSQDERPLIANNYFTADASLIYAQSGLAGIISLNQTAGVVKNAIDDIAAFIPAGQADFGLYMGASRIRTKTGSYVDLENLSGAMILSKKISSVLGDTVFGMFGEFGRGNYDSFASVPHYGEIFGKGNALSYGGGFFTKTFFKNKFYFEATVRGGMIKNKFRMTRDPWLTQPGIHSYESDSGYAGASAGLGRKFNLSERTELDLYGQYLWTRTNKDKFITRFGDNVNIAAINSSKARVGARLKHTFKGERVSIYLGGAAEREFDGKVSGWLNGDPISNPPSFKGTSYIGELGLNIRPTEFKKIILNFEAFGVKGRQKGYGGIITLTYNF